MGFQYNVDINVSKKFVTQKKSGCVFCIVKIGIPSLTMEPSSNDLTFPTFFKITQADAINVIVPTINADLFRRINYEFERPLNFEQVSALIDSPERIIRISQQQIGSVDAFIEEILINNLDKFETSFKLISNE
jgi:hypothetical protein